jgi:ubiquinone biosynthesis protein
VQEFAAAMRAWIETIDIVPETQHAYAPLVVDGLVFFIGQLPPARIEAIAADQLALPAEATADERLTALARRCPTLHKLGQVVARQAGLPATLRARLQSLEMSRPLPGAYDISALIAREIGTVPGLTVAAQPLAEGSVAVVVPFRWEPDGVGSSRSGVFKVLKPDAEANLLEDLAVWPALGDYLEARCAHYGLAAVDIRGLLDGVARLLSNEIRLDGEQRWMTRARSFYADASTVRIPELFPFCTPRLTAMERIAGVQVTDPGVPLAARISLARTIVEALLAQPFWSAPARRPFFHADPHAGNLFATPDAKLAIFDWALTTELPETALSAVVRTLLGAASLDAAAVARALAALGRVNRASALRDRVDAALGEVRRGAFPGFGWLTPLLDRLARDGVLTFPEETALFRKALLTLGGVVRDVWPAGSIDAVLIDRGGREFVAEAWGRALAPPDSRAFGTHVSTDDLARFFGALAWTPARYWVGFYRDVLGSFSA